MREERIISDYYEKTEKKPFLESPRYKEFNRKIIAVNEMYGWLYSKGILKKESFEYHDLPKYTHFAIDVKDLEKHRKSMENSGVSDAALAVQHIFDEDYTPCIYSGAIQLARYMGGYRDLGGCVERTWECDLICRLDTKSIYKVLNVREKKGVKKAVKFMYNLYIWDVENECS